MASPSISFDVNFDIDSVLSHVKYDLQANFGINDSSTPAYWHECASGTAYFYKINDAGTKTLESGKYFLILELLEVLFSMVVECLLTSYRITGVLVLRL